MYSGGSVVGIASTTGREMSPISPLIFTGGRGVKMRILASFSTSFDFEPPAFENAARYPNYEIRVQCCDDRPMSLPSLVKALSVMPHPLKLHSENVLNRR